MARSKAYIGSLAPPFTWASHLAIAATALDKVDAFQPFNCLRALSICQGAIPSSPANSNDFCPRFTPETFAIPRNEDAIALVIITGSVPVVMAWRKVIKLCATSPVIT